MPWFSAIPQLLGSLASKPGARVPSLPFTSPQNPVRETQFSIAKLGILRWFFKRWCQVGRIVFGSHSCDNYDEDLTSWSELMSDNGDNAKFVGCNSSGEPLKSTDNLSILANTTTQTPIGQTRVLFSRESAGPMYQSIPRLNVHTANYHRRVRFGYLLPLKRPGYTQHIGLYRMNGIILPFVLVLTRETCGVTYLSHHHPLQLSLKARTHGPTKEVTTISIDTFWIGLEFRAWFAVGTTKSRESLK
jgi:hypothetical protein